MIVVGFMTRQDVLGLTSIVRELCLNPKHYTGMLNFFRSRSWDVDGIIRRWVLVVAKFADVFCEDGMPVLIGDGVKAAKEARRMPCVKRLHEAGGNSGSGSSSYMFGHMFGAIGILIGDAAKKLSLVPVSIRIHDGDAMITKWANPNDDCQSQRESHVVRVIREACGVARDLGKKSILLLDRYYLTVPALRALLDEEVAAGAGGSLLSLVVRAKRNAVAYFKPDVVSNKPSRGRPRKKGEALKVIDLFETAKDDFITAKVTLYGKEETISYLCRDLLWGQGLYQELRFVLVQMGSTKAIFVSTDLLLAPEQIIRLYSYRFKIECTFRELKQVIAGFAYRFWTSSVPKLNRFAKSGIDNLETVTNRCDQFSIALTHKAITGFVMLSSIALGLLQMLSLRFANTINNTSTRWLRTKSNKIPSEATTAQLLGKTIFRTFGKRHGLDILHFIEERQSPIDDVDCVLGLGEVA